MQRYIFGILFAMIMPAAGFSQNFKSAGILHPQDEKYVHSERYPLLASGFRKNPRPTDKVVGAKSGIKHAEKLIKQLKYTKALKLLVKMDSAVVKHHKKRLQARIESDVGQIYYKEGKNKLAMNHYMKALPIAREKHLTKTYGNIYSNIGSIYCVLGKYKTSLDYRRKALQVFKKIHNKKYIAIGLNNIGYTYKKLLLYDDALKYYNRSLNIEKKISNEGAMAATYDNLANVFNVLGHYSQALVAYQKSLKFHKKVGNPAKTAFVLNNMGVLYHRLGQQKQALAYYRKSLRLKKHFARPGELADTYKNIASRLWDLNQRKKAMKDYKKALALEQKEGSSTNTDLGQFLFDLGRIELNSKHFSKFHHYFHKAQVIAEATKNPKLLNMSVSQLGKWDLMRGRNHLAIKNYKKALGYSRQLGKEQYINSLIHLADAYHKVVPDSALHYGLKAIHLIEDERNQAGPLFQFKAGYFKKHANFYIDVASWLLKYKNDDQKAYKLIELSKARVLTDQLANASKTSGRFLPQKDRLKLAKWRSNIYRLNNKLINTSARGKKTGIVDRINTEELEYASQIQKLHKKYPRYRAFKKPKTVTLQQAKKMCDSETDVLEYAVAGNKLVIFLIGSNDVKTKQYMLDGNHSSLKKRVMHFRRAILSGVSRDSIQTLSKPIYHRLVEPFQQKLAKVKNILVVPDSFLAYLPFEALIHNNNYLVSDYNIKYVPSMTGLSLIHRPRLYPDKKLLALAYANETHLLTDAPLLPSANHEVESISKYFPNTRVLTGDALTKKRARSLMQKKYSVIHIATHSFIDRNNSSMSGIMLGRSGHVKNLKNDGFLRSSEISRMHIHSNLVVLSSCNTGTGQIVDGEGMLGLQRSFLTAGASTVVVSLWNVFDRSTARLMQYFYRSLENKEDVEGKLNHWWQSMLHWTGWDPSIPFGRTAIAMRKAKLKMLHTAKYHNPVYWAPFIVVGR